MLDTGAVRPSAERIRAAYEGAPAQPLAADLQSADVASLYALQDINTTWWLDHGRQLAGRKIGLTSAATQAQLGADRPNHGVLYADTAIDDGGVVPLAAGLRQPRAEAEVALVLGRDLTSSTTTVADVIAAVAYATAAIEIVDSRIADWKVTFADMVADNGFAARYVLSRSPRSLLDLDLLTCGMILEINGRIASLGAGAACLGHPLAAAAWLARTLAATGRPLTAGEVILTGALGPMVPVKPGDVVQVTIGGLGQARVSFEAPAPAAT